MEQNNGTELRAKQEALYIEIKAFLQRHIPVMRKASDTILDQEVSSYPIFVIHQAENVELGVPLVARDPAQLKEWSINASTLEEMAAKKVVDMARVDRFRQIFKDPKNYYCLFILSENGANFLFL
ncbi:MAG: hypothetical protein AAFO07_16535 [Bacteroidota bacterium]